MLIVRGLIGVIALIYLSSFAEAGPLSAAEELKLVGAIKSIKAMDGRSVGEILTRSERVLRGKFKVQEIGSSYDSDMNFINQGTICYFIGNRTLDGEQYCGINAAVSSKLDQARLVLETADAYDLTTALHLGQKAFVSALSRAYELDCLDKLRNKRSC